MLRSVAVRGFEYAIVVAAVSASSCAEPDAPADDAASPRPGMPAESNPLRQGFTQNPDPDTPGLPPPIPPFLTDAERDAADEMRLELSEAEAAAAQDELASLVEAFERDADEAIVAAIRDAALKLTRRGRILHEPVATLYQDYLFPNSQADADAKYRGKLVVLTGRVAPLNMKDFADGFKLIEQNPYVHDPLLLATDYELSFVECRLAQPELQLLRDWQPIHFVAEVEGKKASDVMLRRCVVL